MILTALFGAAPYFGGNTLGLQSAAHRHLFLNAALHLAIPPSRPVRVLEIGAWTGSSTLSLAQGIRALSPLGGEIVCVDPWKSYFGSADVRRVPMYRTMDMLAQTDLAYQLFLHNTKSIKGDVKLAHHRGTTRKVLPKLRGPFDLVYIDGSHYYDDVMFDLRASDRLLREGGILCGDDLEMQVGQVDRALVEGVIAEDYFGDSATGQAFHPGVTLAVADFFGRFIHCVLGFWAVQKHKTGYRDVSFEGARIIVPDHFSAEQKEQCQKVLDRATAVGMSRP